jgi:hypothetical protein
LQAWRLESNFGLTIRKYSITLSLYELHGSWTDFDKFGTYGAGREVASEWSQMEEMNERLRFFVEECDHIHVSCFPPTNY